MTRTKVTSAALAVLLAACLSQDQAGLQGATGEIAYYGRTITWLQVERLRERGMASYGITWQAGGIAHSAAFDTEAELDSFTAQLIEPAKAR